MSGGGNFDVSMYRAISSIVIASILFCVEARECMARTNSSCHQYQIAIIAVIAVLFSVIFSAFFILFLHVSGRSILSPIQTIRILSLSASFAISRIHFSSNRKRYSISSEDRFLILSSESAQKLANGIPRFLVSRMIFFAFS